MQLPKYHDKTGNALPKKVDCFNQSGYPGCGQTGETVVMHERLAFGKLEAINTKGNPMGSCQVHLTTTIH